MTVFSLGTQLTLTCSIRNVAGQLADATDVICVVRDESLPVTNPSVGLYTATYLPPAVGDYEAEWVATGLNACTLVQRFSVSMYGAVITDDDVLGWLPDAMSEEEKNRWVTLYADPHRAAGKAWQAWAARLKAAGADDVAVTSVSTGAQSISYGVPTSASEQAMMTARWHFSMCTSSIISPDYNHVPEISLSRVLPPTWRERGWPSY